MDEPMMETGRLFFAGEGKPMAEAIPVNQAKHSIQANLNQAGPTLPGVKRGPLSAQEQALAVQQLHEHAQRRLALGMQLFENAQKQTQVHQALADQLRKEQDGIREQMQTDMTRSLHAYDQWIGKVEHDFAARLDVLDQRMSELQAQWQSMSERVEGMMNRAELLLDQARLISQAATQLSRQPVQVRSVMPTVTPRPMTVVTATSVDSSTKETALPRLAEETVMNEPTVRYLELLDLLRQAPPSQNAA